MLDSCFITFKIVSECIGKMVIINYYNFNSQVMRMLGSHNPCFVRLYMQMEMLGIGIITFSFSDFNREPKKKNHPIFQWQMEIPFLSVMKHNSPE